MTLPATFQPSTMMAKANDGSMRAHVDTTARRLMDLDAEAALLTWDPVNCPAEWLPVCAFNYSVSLFEPIWSEQTQRDWIAGNYGFIRKIGTPPAYDVALAPSGMRVADMVLPPQAFYATETLSKAEMDEWIRLAPKIRVTYGNRVGEAGPYIFAGDEVFATDDTDPMPSFVGPNDGPVLIGRFATLVKDGVETPLYAAVETNTFEPVTYEVKVSYATPGTNRWGVFVGDYFAGEDERCFVGADEDEPLYLSATLDQTYIHQDTSYQLDFINPGLPQARVNYETESLVGDAGLSVFVGDCFAGDEVFATENDAPYLLADVFYLYDPSIVVHTNSFGSFVGDRVGIDLRTMILMVDLGMTATAADPFVEDCFIGEIFATPTDTEPFWRALRAIEAARGQADQVLVAFDHMRPVEAQDMFTEATPVDAWVPNSL